MARSGDFLPGGIYRIAVLRDFCPCCRGRGEFALAAHLDESRMSAATFASRKRPELMHHEFWECTTCQSYFTPVLPDFDELHGEYRDASFDSGVEASFASRTYARALTARLPDLRCGSALDIGTGDGAFLDCLLDLGFDYVVGVEPSEAPIAAASARVRPLIVEGMFEPDMFQSNTFDLVTCFQTIEHVPDPDTLVREALRILKPGGYLAIVCHDRLALANRAMGRRSPIFDVEHLQLLTRRGLSILMSRVGFEDVSVGSIKNTYPARYWLRIAPLPKRIGDAIDGLADSSLLGTPISVGVGNLLGTARKPLTTGRLSS